jgi:hypothetical protein
VPFAAGATNYTSVRLRCAEGEYNDLATLLWPPREHVLFPPRDPDPQELLLGPKNDPLRRYSLCRIFPRPRQHPCGGGIVRAGYYTLLSYTLSLLLYGGYMESLIIISELCG